MATIPTFTTFVAGTVVVASQLNTQIVAAGNFYNAKPYCFVFNTTGPTITTAVFLLVPYDSEAEDNDSMHSTASNTSRVVFQTPGLFTINSFTGFSSASSAGNRLVNIRLNSGGAIGGGTAIAGRGVAPPSSLSGPTIDFTFRYRAVNAGDYFETFADQNSGGGLALNTGQYVTGMTALWEIA